MRRIVVISALAVALAVVVFAPANLTRIGFTQIDGVELIQPRGSIWNGSGVLVFDSGISANLNWQIIWDISRGLTPNIKWQLTQKQTALNGTVTPGLKRQTIDIEGHFTGALLAPHLAKYDILIPGTFRVPASRILINRTAKTMQIELAEGTQLLWSGGLVRYTLSNGLEQVSVPELTVTLMSVKDSLPTATIALTKNNTGSLLTLTPEVNGYVNIQVTRGFIELMGQNWSGSAQPNDVVVAVKRKVF